MSDEKSVRVMHGRFIDVRIDVQKLQSAFESICAGARDRNIEDTIQLAYSLCQGKTKQEAEALLQALGLLTTLHIGSFDGCIKSDNWGGDFDLQSEWSDFLTHSAELDQEHKPEGDTGRETK